jgi:hypothetical protein
MREGRKGERKEGRKDRRKPSHVCYHPHSLRGFLSTQSPTTDLPRKHNSCYPYAVPIIFSSSQQLKDRKYYSSLFYR